MVAHAYNPSPWWLHMPIALAPGRRQKTRHPRTPPTTQQLQSHPELRGNPQPAWAAEPGSSCDLELPDCQRVFPSLWPERNAPLTLCRLLQPSLLLRFIDSVGGGLKDGWLTNNSLHTTTAAVGRVHCSYQVLPMSCTID